MQNGGAEEGTGDGERKREAGRGKVIETEDVLHTLCFQACTGACFCA